jgi:hypothetical protein
MREPDWTNRAMSPALLYNGTAMLAESFHFRIPESAGIGTLRALFFDGLWGIQFGNGVSDQPTTTLFFEAGPNGESDGLYGTVTPTSPAASPGGGHGHGH